MAEHRESGSRVSPEGRVVIPAEVRRHLGVSGGDLVQFVMLEDGHVELVTPRMLAVALWANNHGGDALDSTELVRAERMLDQHVQADSDQYSAVLDADEDWDEDAATARLLSALGMAQ
jgi:AbrB family looped-hinge helix DNA binding protein